MIVQQVGRISYKKLMVSIISNISLAAAVIIGGYAVVNVYLLKRSLPSGVCPVIRNRLLIYAAIVLCIVSFILSFFDKKVEKTNKEEKS
jgi:hypothetical protein